MKLKKPETGESLADLNPGLADQWHPTKNGDLTPYDVTPGSDMKVWWKCPKGDDHVWSSTISSRTAGNGCSICANMKVVNSNCLATLNPALAKEWHPTKNGDLTPYNVVPSSHKKAWWKCPKGVDHEWISTIANRSSGKGCPICANMKVVNSNCLATLNPALAKEWHPTKNGDLTPYDVIPGTPQKVWWKCPKGEDHEWQTSIVSRNNGGGCPICSGRKVVNSNCLATVNPALAKEWHPTKNGDRSPYGVSAYSGIKVWWKCPKGDDHEWKTAVRNRSYGNGCPVCSGRQAARLNSLATLKPELAKQWHPTKNGNLTAYDVKPSSNKKVWWKCPEGADHEWKTAIAHRSTGQGCPICSGYKVVKSTSIATVNPELAKEWHPTKNGKLTASEVGPGSGTKVWWKCHEDDDHEWQAIVSNRTKGSGCPICSKLMIIPSNSLSILNPELAKEWHPTKNGKLTPFNVGVGSTKKVWWRCNTWKDHEWQAPPGRRSGGTGCPFCTNPSSTPELRIFSELKTIFPSALHRKKINGHEVDILIPELNIAIEYDGEFWHRKKQKQDLRKNEMLKDKVTLIRVRDKGLPLLTENDIKQTTRNITINTVKDILQLIVKLCEIQSTEILNGVNEYNKQKKWIASEHFKILFAARNHITFEESISYLFPEVTKEWHPTKNDSLLPRYFSPGSNKKVWWKCNKGDDHEWEATIVTRCLNGVGCPICSNKKIVASNCLATLDPELAKEWHPAKNGKLTPYNVGIGSNKKVWWKCNKGDDHEWRVSVIHRTARGTGCPVCANKKVVASNCLATLNPELAKEWHPTKNGKLTPYNVGVGSNKSVWWKCNKGDDHEWKALIITRQNGLGCPICSNQKVVKSNSLATLNPELAKEWHPTKNGRLTAYDVGPGSSKKVWWKCPKGDDHEWEATLHNRKYGRGCPVCSRRKVTKSNCLATLNPELAKEWHPWKNETLTSMNVTPGSQKKVWWQNNLGQEWQEIVYNRVQKSRKRVDPDQFTLFEE